MKPVCGYLVVIRTLSGTLRSGEAERASRLGAVNRSEKSEKIEKGHPKRSDSAGLCREDSYCYGLIDAGLPCWFREISRRAEAHPGILQVS